MNQGFVEGLLQSVGLREPIRTYERFSSKLPRIQLTMVLLAALGVWPGVRADAGVNVWTSHGPEGGGVYQLVVVPGNPTKLLATGSGGLWASSDAAATWHQSAAPREWGDVYALVLDPTNPAVAYAATTHAGIIKSQDSGEHWTPVSTLRVQVIAIAPSRPTTIYAADQSAFYRSDDSGLSWRPVTSLPAGTYVVSVAVQPDSELTVYAGTYGTGLFKSTDGGMTWAAAGAGLPGSDVLWIDHLTFVFHDPANLLAVAVDRRTWQSGLYRSTDGGATWVAVFSYPGPAVLSGLELGPGNPLLIYLIADRALFKSGDDGATWITLTIPPGTGPFAVDPNNPDVVYAGGTDVFKSTDGGTTWAPSGRGLINTSVAELAIDAGPANTLYAVRSKYRNYSELFGSQDNGRNWISLGEIPFCYFPTAIVVDPSNSNTLYVGGEANGAFKSSDGGRSWVRINQGFDSWAHRVYALAVDPSNPRTLYAGSHRSFDLGTWSGNPVYKTTNGGLEWHALSSFFSGHATNVIALAVDPRNPSTVYAGASGLWKSTDGGRSWSLVPRVSYFPTSVAVDPRGSGTVFCASEGLVYRITNEATTSSSPPSGARRLVLDPSRPSTVYVSGSRGVSMSLDSGTTWTLINGGLTNFYVTALVIDGTGTMLHAATDGHGVFDLEISTATPEISLSPDSLTMPAGTNTVLTATIDPPQLTDTQLEASSSDRAVVSVPEVVTLPAGETSVSLTVTGVVAGGPAEISVRLPASLGGASGAATVTVTGGTTHVPRRHLRRPKP